MKSITTIILGAVSLLLAIVISAMESGADAGGSRRSQLIRFDEKSAEKITLYAAGESLVMQKVQEFWYFLEPDQDRINTNSMESLLDMLNHLTVLDELESEELVGEMTPVNLDLTGDHALEVVIDSKVDGKIESKKILVGRPTPRANSVYAQVYNGKNPGPVTVVNGNPHDILDAPYETLLERQLVNIPSVGLMRLNVQTHEGGVSLQRGVKSNRATPWNLADPIVAKADQEKVEDLIADIMALQIADIESVDSSPIPKPLPKDSAVIQFGIYNTAKPLVLYLEKIATDPDYFGPPKISARISDRPARYILNSMLLDSLNAQASKLRDRRLYKVPEKALESIAIVTENPPNEVLLQGKRKRTGIDWDVLINGTAVDANYEKIKNLITQMDERVIIDFVEEGKLIDFGIAPNQRGPRLWLLILEFPAR